MLRVPPSRLGVRAAQRDGHGMERVTMRMRVCMNALLATFAVHVDHHQSWAKLVKERPRAAGQHVTLRPCRVNLDDQKEVINLIGKKFNGTIVYRTLDIGGDKQVSYLNLPVEENPFLGVRGIRLSLANEDIFTSQVKSILLSGYVDQIKIMFPMISTVSDFLEAKSFVENIATELNVSMPQLGIMVETPSSVFLVDKFAEVVDFISIGTNDLTQYIMAADRGNTQLSHYQDPLSPAVIRAISKVIDVGREHNIEVSVCGEMASDLSLIHI